MSLISQRWSVGRDLQINERVIVGGRRVGDGGVWWHRMQARNGCFMRPLTFTSLAFQSAVSIKGGCSSYVFPIHQRPKETRPHTDGQLSMMEREEEAISRQTEKKGKILRRKRMREVKVTHTKRDADKRGKQTCRCKQKWPKVEFYAKSWGSGFLKICFVKAPS